MKEELKPFIDFFSSAKRDLNLEREVAFEVGCSEAALQILDEAIFASGIVEEKFTIGHLKINHVNQFHPNISSIQGALRFRGQPDSSFVRQQDDDWKNDAKKLIQQASAQISFQLQQLNFNLAFFEKIGYLSGHIVAIGANGSGKTTLSNLFKTYLGDNGVVISAQRILLVPNFDSISNPTYTANELRDSQARDKTNKHHGEFGHLQNEFAILLKNLLADNISAATAYRKRAFELSEEGGAIREPTPTNLDKTFTIWNTLIEHRIIDCADGMNITAKPQEGKDYPAVQMSDGEKVMLYLIAQVLQAPANGFIVIDEPEMYLHKTILKKLWDTLEAERQDCLFIYLTHDLDFATSRSTAKKIWIKSFSHPDRWEIEDIPENEIPETLLFELLGSRKNILFCEGQKGSIDEKVLSIILPEFTVMPVGSCFEVINHTKAFNSLRNVNTRAFGIIDSDHHDQTRLVKLVSDKVFSLKVAEVENLFLDEKFLKLMAAQLLVDKDLVQNIKHDIIAEFNKLKETQTAHYISTKINYYFKDSHVSRGNRLEEVESNFKKFTERVDVNKWYKARIELLDKIVMNGEYESVISIFNNKGLHPVVSRHFKISDFTERCIKLLQSSKDSRECILAHMPTEIREAGTSR
ncbi:MULTISPECIES: AAA family ATPase [unclassified Imperialibacter]|uniref:AAA family ATPase n=1 Tax=unclassified Imperialibacter TaxID=2629706 RepID=UPI001254E4E9|nr:MULTISPECIES: AAA family ATPase [unclassified Imperialibacter]CAD5277586.1 ABC transporter ATP-binding protein [Imperialibacter sp. 89]CAD5299546.1 ABC transporter ATP-binding protein [Imperialibacter sp. 75]VVT27541.1 ABC transporter ATP-binding protein [Imperialibacter sp. EC-SDR9]